jgi:diguanylate cyclase (GGDEF)-like protein/PAS domain S-box-containing protein
LVDYDVLCSLLVVEGDESIRTRLVHEVPEPLLSAVRHRLLDELGQRPHGAVVSERMDTIRSELSEPPAEPCRVPSFVGVPLEVKGQAVGLICLAARHESAFSDADARLLHSIVEKMAETVERLQRTIRGEQDKMQSMVASMAEGVIMFDANEELMVLNPKARAMLGLTAGEEFSTHSLTRSIVWREISAFLAEPVEGEGASREFTVDTESKPRTLHVAVAPVLDESGGRLGRLAVIRDVTRERELDRMKSDFVAVVSHELRTPLASIKMFTSNLLDEVEGEINEDQRETLSRVGKNLDRLSRLINDLLDLSKLEAGKMEMKIGPVDVAEMMRSTCDVFAAASSNKNVAIDVDLPEELPLLWADADRVVQVLTNLVGNALKFTPEKGTVTLSVRRRPPEPPDRIAPADADSTLSGEGSLLVSVRDTGPGIPEDDVARVFDKFYQTDHSMTRKTGGTGLGLPICKEIVTRHGGQIWAESRVGEGSTFSFELPVDCRSHDRAALRAAIDREIRRARRYRVPFSILMVDIDDFGIINEEHGYGRGDTALAECQEIVREEVKRFLEARVRETDVVGRFGGDEFLVIAPETEAEGARQFAERVRSIVDDHEFAAKDHRFRVTVSIGATAFHDEDPAPVALLRRAAAALTDAKGRGKNQVAFTDQTPDERTEHGEADSAGG